MAHSVVLSTADYVLCDKHIKSQPN